MTSWGADSVKPVCNRHLVSYLARVPNIVSAELITSQGESQTKILLKMQGLVPGCQRQNTLPIEGIWNCRHDGGVGSAWPHLS